MASFKRYRVSNGVKGWNEPGPDLLRTRSDAEKAMAKLLLVGLSAFRVRTKAPGKEFSEWSDKLSRKQVLRRLQNWRPGSTFQVGKGKPGDIKVVAVMQVEVVKLMELSNVHPDVETTWSLIHHQYPNVVFAGGYVYKQIAGSTSWSDHAWGDALDATPRGAGADNDKLYDWQVRMGKTGNLPVHGYILGSKGGRVKRANAPGFVSMPSLASTSHLWHNHDSIFDHGGKKPPREGGYSG